METSNVLDETKWPWPLTLVFIRGDDVNKTAWAAWNLLPADIAGSRDFDRFAMGDTIPEAVNNLIRQLSLETEDKDKADV